LNNYPSNWNRVSNDEDCNIITVADCSAEAKEVLDDFQAKLERKVEYFSVRFFLFFVFIEN
jgi:hypothetical protein